MRKTSYSNSIRINILSSRKVVGTPSSKLSSDTCPSLTTVTLCGRLVSLTYSDMCLVGRKLTPFAAAEKLITNDVGEMTGVKVRKADGRLHKVMGKNVMLACGGFEGNREMLAKYVGPRTTDLPLIAPGLKYNTGAGLNMALEVGAGTAGSFEGIHCELVDTRAKKPDAVIWGHGYGIVVNEKCQRFYDEGKRHLFATFEMIALETWRDHNQKAYFVTDKTIMNRFRPGWVYDTTDEEPEQADTIPELAKKLGVDPDALDKTVKDFNAACNKNEFNLMALDGKRTTGLNPDKTNWANPIDTPPYYGYPLTSNLTFTYGGIKTNTDAQVLSTNHVPIPGLYAAGELTGLFYHEVSLVLVNNAPLDITLTSSSCSTHPRHPFFGLSPLAESQALQLQRSCDCD